jgi:hypothetical protein
VREEVKRAGTYQHKQTYSRIGCSRREIRVPISRFSLVRYRGGGGGGATHGADGAGAEQGGKLAGALAVRGWARAYAAVEHLTSGLASQ